MNVTNRKYVTIGLATVAIAGIGTALALSPLSQPATPRITADSTHRVPRGVPIPTPKPKQKDKPMTAEEAKAYREAIARTANMVSDPRAQRMASRHGLNILNLTWEDTGRYKGSAVGPNISDMTIQVAARDPRSERLSVTCMPVIRFPNFSDRTADLDPRDFTLLVGNEHEGQPLRRVSLYDFLAEPTAFLTKPASWKGDKPKTLLAPERDSKILVSAQACFLPIPKSGKATFNPVLFNYQSFKDNPAVLTILVTREGTSTTIIDNTRDAFETGSVWGQRLFHNAGGQRASLTGERESDFKTNGGGGGQVPSVDGAGKKESGLNMVLLIQVPLKQKERPRRLYDMAPAASGAGAPMAKARARDESNVENAVIGHGDLEGPYTEIANLPIERDPRYPVRVTVQFYKATDNGVVSDKDLSEIAAQINRVYAKSDYVGSLVTEGETGRITEYAGAKVQPADWWERFWDDYEQHFGVPRAEAIRRLHTLLGDNYQQRPVTRLYVRDLLRRK